MNIEWNETYSVFNKDIDNQHKNLFDILDSFNKELETNLSNNKAIQIIIDSLKKYTINHFEYEEDFMTKMNYPYIKLHQQKHHLFIEKIKDYESRYQTGVNVLPAEIITFLKEWLIRHIYVEDKMYANFIASK